jgi:hypothetical protein
MAIQILRAGSLPAYPETPETPGGIRKAIGDRPRQRPTRWETGLKPRWREELATTYGGLAVSTLSYDLDGTARRLPLPWKLADGRTGSRDQRTQNEALTRSSRRPPDADPRTVSRRWAPDAAFAGTGRCEPSIQLSAASIEANR